MSPFRSVDEVQRFAKKLEYHSVEERRKAALKLSEAVDPRAFPHLVEALGNSDGVVREFGARGLVRLNDPRSFSHLAGVLKDDLAEVRAVAADGLGKLGDPRALGPLMRIASTDEDPAVRRTAVSALGGLGRHAAPAIPILARFLADENLGGPASKAIVTISRSLAGKPVEGEREKALAMLAPHFREDEEPRVVKGAIEAALNRKIGERNARAYLEKMRAGKGAVEAALKRETVEGNAPSYLEKTRAGKRFAFSPEEERVLRKAHGLGLGGVRATKLVSQEIGPHSKSWVYNVWGQLGLKTTHRFGEGRPALPAEKKPAVVKARGLRGRPGIGPEKAGRLLEAHDLVMSLGEAAKSAGVSSITAKKYWKKAGLKPHGNREIARARAKRVAERWLRDSKGPWNAELLDKIARDFGITPDLAEEYLRSEGITKPQGGSRTAKLKAVAPVGLLEEALPLLTKAESLVIRERGYLGGEKKTLGAIAKALGVSRQAVHLSETLALRKAGLLQELRRRASEGKGGDIALSQLSSVYGLRIPAKKSESLTVGAVAGLGRAEISSRLGLSSDGVRKFEDALSRLGLGKARQG